MSRRTKLLILGLLLVTCVASALVQNYQEQQRQAMRPAPLFDVVWRQIMAMRSDDFASAYRHVSTGFQEKFNVEAFADLARTDYPAVRTAERVEFGAVRWDGRRALVPVYFFLPNGEVIPCIYNLLHEDEQWKIDGVRVQKRWPAGRRLGGMRA